MSEPDSPTIVHIDNPKEKDTAVYSSLKCFRCGGRIEACELADTWTMLIDGMRHKVPVRRVPCNKCFDCNTVTLDQSSDDMVVYCYNAYLQKHGLNTPYLRARRWIRRRIGALQTRAWLWRRWFNRVIMQRD